MCVITVLQILSPGALFDRAEEVGELPNASESENFYEITEEAVTVVGKKDSRALTTVDFR